jgi:hypothetical protein
MKKLILVGTLGLSVSGCITSQTMPLAPNMVQIDTKARGLLFTGQAVPETMRQAAKATLDAGYTHFKFTNAGIAVGDDKVSACGWSGGGGNCAQGFSPTAQNSVTVIMYRANDPEARNAFDAAATLAKYQS